MRILLNNLSGISRIISLFLLVILTHPAYALDRGQLRSEYEISRTIKPPELERDNQVDMISDFKGNLYLLQSNLNRVVKLSPEAEIESAIGAFGFGVGQFNLPSALSSNDGGLNIYVLDSENRRIVRLNSELKWLDQITLKTTYDEQIVGGLTGLALNSLGEFYVSDPRNFRILKFDGGGRLLDIIEGKQRLIEPGHLVVDENDYLYACDLSENLVRVFDDLGNLAGSIGRNFLSAPWRLACNGNKLFVLDRKLNDVVIIKLSQKADSQLFLNNNEGKLAAVAVKADSILIFDSQNRILQIYIKRKN